MAYSFLHINGFEGSTGPELEYSSTELTTSYSQIYYGATGWNSRPTPYGSGQMLWCWASQLSLAPWLPGGPYPRLGVHFMFGLDSLVSGSMDLIRFRDMEAGTDQVIIRLVPGTGAYNLQAWRGSVQLGQTVPDFYVPGSANWQFLSVFLEVSPSDGRLAVVGGMNDDLLIDFSGNTQNSANPFVHRVFAGPLNQGVTCALDDVLIYTADPGDPPVPRSRVYGLVAPQSDVQVQFSRSDSGPNFGAVNGFGNVSGRYLVASVPGTQDLYGMGSPGFSGSILATALVASFTPQDPGPGSVRLLGETEDGAYASQAFAVRNGVRQRVLSIFDGNPVSETEWIPAHLNSGWKIGFRLE